MENRANVIYDYTTGGLLFNPYTCKIQFPLQSPPENNRLPPFYTYKMSHYFHGNIMRTAARQKLHFGNTHAKLPSEFFYVSLAKLTVSPPTLNT